VTKAARQRSLRGEDGAAIITVVLMLPLFFVFAALVVDIGRVWGLKRHLQASADAAALAAAQELPDDVAADSTAWLYSASTGGWNQRTSLPAVATTVEFPEPHYEKVRVIQKATSPLFFGGIIGVDGIEVTARATASRVSTVTGTPLAVYVHELCGNKGLIAGGLNMRIEGGIHVNGHLEIKNPGFESLGPATVFRPPDPASPTPPLQPVACKTTDVADSVYCTGCGSGPVNNPVPGAYRDWVTPYHTPADVTARAPCTHSPSGDVLFDNQVIQASQEGVYCLAPGKEFKISGTVTGPGGAPAKITVLADKINIGGNGKLTPYNAGVPVLFYSTSGFPGRDPSLEIKLNPSQAYDWNGYIIHRRGGIVINAAGVTSPQEGLLEAEWVEINGENFTMLGTFPDTSGGGLFVPPALEE
jgi:hypothetical protein